MSEAAIPTTLGHSTVFLLNEGQFKRNVVESLFTHQLNSNKENVFCGPQPVSIEKKDIFEKLFKNEYLVCEKSDGQRMYLWITRLSGKPAIFLINRNLDIYIAPLKINEECFEGSLFDGEFIQRNDGKFYFIIHDCWMYCGISHVHTPSHKQRWFCIHDFLTKRYIHGEGDCCQLTIKVFYDVGRELGETWVHIQQNKKNYIDGLIFTPKMGCWKFGRDWDLLKWKSESMHTIDLKVKVLQTRINLQILSNKKYETVETIYPQQEEHVQIMEFINQHCANNKHAIVEFIVEPKTDAEGWTFKPYRSREDKNVPNGKITYQNTLKNITENLKVEDFVNILDNVGDLDVDMENLEIQ